MINNVNNFLSAKVASDKSVVYGKDYNYLIDLVNRAIKILDASGTGLEIDSTGSLELGDELQALEALTDTAGLIQKTADAAYAIVATDAENDFVVGNDSNIWAKKTKAEAQDILEIEDIAITFAIALG